MPDHTLAIDDGAEMLADSVSHYLACDHAGISKEELYVTLHLRLPRIGERTVRYAIYRYRHSSGWSDWRMRPDKIEPSQGIGDWDSPTRRAIEGACEPIVQAWLASGDYLPSRRRAAARMVHRAIRDQPVTGYGVRRMRDALREQGSELTAADRRRLTRAVDLLEKAAVLLDA